MTTTVTTEAAQGLALLYHDAHLLAVDKPSLLLSVPGRGPEKHDSVLTRARRHWPGARIVHRLDWETSGVLLLALDGPTQSALNRQFARREIDKEYRARVAGRLACRRLSIRRPLVRDWPNRPRQMVDWERGKPSLTHVERLGHHGPDTCLCLRPVTGRSHQLRVHLLDIGHPILGDRLYGPPGSREAADRLLLHAHRLAFIHPATGERLALEAPLPF